MKTKLMLTCDSAINMPLSREKRLSGREIKPCCHSIRNFSLDGLDFCFRLWYLNSD